MTHQTCACSSTDCRSNGCHIVRSGQGMQSAATRSEYEHLLLTRLITLGSLPAGEQARGQITAYINACKDAYHHIQRSMSLEQKLEILERRMAKIEEGRQ